MKWLEYYQKNTFRFHLQHQEEQNDLSDGRQNENAWEFFQRQIVNLRV